MNCCIISLYSYFDQPPNMIFAELAELCSTHDISTQLEPDDFKALERDDRAHKGCDGYGIFYITLLTDFIYATKTHSARCACAKNTLCSITRKACMLNRRFEVVQ